VENFEAGECVLGKEDLKKIEGVGRKFLLDQKDDFRED